MKNLVLGALVVLAISSCERKVSTTSMEVRIDSLFHFWDKPNSPGAAVAVLQDGKITFSKGYGMANLEYKVPITPQSIFHIASESKQYTAFCMVLLAKEGKLSLDDDVRKHLPWVPDFGKTITIKHLIHHTSGLRDQWQLFAIAGQGLDDVIRQSEVIKLVERQKELNFEPGSRHMYCNTGYTLMAEIVKSVTGKTLREYADEKIFKPLSMSNTHFHDNNREIIANRTYSYDSADGKLWNAPLNFATVGATSLFTTVEDETKWLNNYATGQVGGKEAIDQMYEQGILTDGTKLTYAFALGIDTIRGYRRIGHGGSDAGYRSYAMRIPETGLGVVVFSNFGGFNPRSLATKVAALYLPDRSVKRQSLKPYKIDSTLYQSYKGLYHTIGENIEILDSGKLYVKFDGGMYPLTPESDTSFTAFDGQVWIAFNRDQNGKTNSFKARDPNGTRIFERYTKPTFSDADLKSYAGTYVCDELDVTYRIVVKDGSLVMQHRRYPDGKMKPVTREHFITGNWWMWNIDFTKDAKGKVTGFAVNSGRILGLKFRKVQ
ncbi:MAG TPA: serine hydrolase domain-containing protein [Cyclobacteriaceae bacterium]|nr:serine hydrolase domain-containing protein [Cyclobacteriaceae bacterium]